MKATESERYTLTTSKASVIRDALSLVLTGVESESDVSPDTYQNLKAFANEGCNRMILDLRTPKERTGENSPGVRNLRASRIGQVLVVTGEVTGPQMLREFDALRRSHLSIRNVTSGLVAVAHMLF